MFPVGIDVSKNTLDLCMLYDGIKGRIKTRNIQNNRHSVENILRWLRLQHCGPEDVHVVMEATGVYHERLATELHDAGFRVSLAGNDSNLLIVFYVQIMPDDFVMQLHRF
ncbi:transposase, IS110 family [Klebsiella pneumoniae]|uniref:Transposase, IS110 family n=1 Tax=Klebsiella pneumoniae TaxID=573 RepID=A0A377W532_KLEPN|nr:transposase, IS110 family [Klebsiella pneumoniae]STT49984.1 transposase, IS110 family [Klebsiella pneumoniae]